jgi:hypothetical protein
LAVGGRIAFPVHAAASQPENYTTAVGTGNLRGDIPAVSLSVDPGKEGIMELALQGAIWLGAGVTLVMLLSRRRKRRVVR